MLQLYIDGQRVNLSEGVRTDYYVKNPFFTNEGDYTLDIDIDLSDPTNAQVYNYLHRMDRVNRPSRREAILQDEHGVLLRGQEVVLETKDGKAKIQIIGGASELNYIMSDRKLQDLDLWSEWDSDERVYVPVCAFNASPHADQGMMDSPQYATEDNVTKLMWQIANKPTWNVQNNNLILSHDCPQPYFWAIVNRVVTALGFDVGTNVIKTDPKYSCMIMVHAYRSRYIADMLPRWTVGEFFDEVQKFFNVIIDLNKETRTVNIVHAWSFFADDGVEVVQHQDVVNTVQKTFDKKSEMTMVDYSTVHYAFTDKPLNKYAALSPSLVRVCSNVNALTMSGGRPYDSNYNAGIWKAMYGDESFLTATSSTGIDADFGERVLYHQQISSEDRTFVWWSAEETFTSLKMVNMFGAKTSIREADTDVEMKIVPARMVSSPLQGNSSRWWQYPLPAVDGEASSYKQTIWGGSGAATYGENHGENINDDIKSGYEEQKEAERADVMFAAFYFGVLPVNWEDSDNNVPNGITVPVAAPDYLVQLHRLKGSPGSNLFWRSQRHVLLSSSKLCTMAINGDNGQDTYSYAKNPTVDTSVAYTILFRSTTIRDVRKVWIIDNRKFYCKELKYDIATNRRSEVVEGVFFPLTEADSSEGGEAMYYVTYNLSRVIIEHRILSVMSNDALHLDLKLDGGGSATASIHAVVLMGNVDITSSAFHLSSNGRTATIDIEHVTGDVHIQAWKE